MSTGRQKMSDEASLLAACERVIAKFPDQAATVRAGKKGVLGFFVGQVMKETGGSANPKLLNQLLERLLA